MFNTPRRGFLFALSALFTRRTSAAAPPGDQVGRTFLQITRYDRMPEKFMKPYFEAVDKYWAPALVKAPGLLMFKRFHHYDLPEKIAIQLWESEEAAKWQDSKEAKELWARTIQAIPAGLSPEYLRPMHSFAHYHYVLDRSFKV
jgi:hypothetical protein